MTSRDPQQTSKTLTLHHDLAQAARRGQQVSFVDIEATFTARRCARTAPSPRRPLGAPAR